jgi:hypothetical protein
VPAGQALFLPLEFEAAFRIPNPPDPMPKVSLNQVPQLRTLLAGPVIDHVTELHVFLDGVSLLPSVTRIKSPVFFVTLPAQDSLVGFTGTIQTVSDGYWLFIPPLPPGDHLLNFGGTLTYPSFSVFTDITDVIHVK